MSNVWEQEERLFKRKKRFSIGKSVMYWLLGYPPILRPLTDKSWEEWKAHYGDSNYVWQEAQ